MCRNEERFLPRCLESLRDVVDEIIVVDTGSTDRSREIAREYGAIVSHFDWIDDFSAARNETHRRASGRWLLAIDCDEYLEGEYAKPGRLKQELLAFEQEYAASWPVLLVKMPLLDRNVGETTSFAMHKQFRIYPRDERIYYEMPIHNRLTLHPDVRGIGTCLELDYDSLHLIHRGYDPTVARDKKKSERAMRILKKALAERPDGLNYFYLGREYFHAENWAMTIDTLEKACELIKASKSPLDQQHLQAIYYYLVVSQHRRGDPIEDIRDALIRALEEFPSNTDLWYEAGCIFMDHGEYEGAMNAFNRSAILLPLAEQNASSFLMHQPWGLYFNAGRVAAALEDEEKSRWWFQKAVDSGMPDSELIQDLLDSRPVDGIVAAGVATTPERCHHLLAMVRSIIGQVDELHIYLNGFNAVPEFLKHEKIRCWLSHEQAGDLRDTGKFWGAMKTAGWDYFFTMDDDILYPANYVCRLVDEIEARGRKAVVGIHAANMRWPVSSYIRDRDVFHCLQALEQPTKVDVLGTGTMAFHRETVDVVPNIFTHHGMTDPLFSAALHRQGVERIAVARRAKWVEVLEVTTGTLYEEAINLGDEVQTQVIQQLLEKSP